MIGYLLASWTDWKLKLSRQGVIPKKLNPDTLTEDVYERLDQGKATVLLTEIPRGQNLLAWALVSAGANETARFCLIEAEYETHHMAKLPDDRVRFAVQISGTLQGHRSQLEGAEPGNWPYKGRSPAVLIRSTLPPGRLRLLADLNLIALLDDSLASQLNLPSAESRHAES